MHFVMFFLMLITIVYAIVQAVTAVEVKFYFYYMYMIGKSQINFRLRFLKLLKYDNFL